MNDERTPAERIAYLRGYAIELQERHTDQWKQEMVEVCVRALEEQVDRILRGEA